MFVLFWNNKWLMGSYSLKSHVGIFKDLGPPFLVLRAQHSDFKREIQNSDIIILQETWNVRDLSTGCPIGFREIILPSTKTERGDTGQRLRGNADMVQNRTHRLNQIYKNRKSYIWLKIQKDIVSTDRHIFLCATYLPPAESPYYNEETFSILQDEICHSRQKEMF